MIIPNLMLYILTWFADILLGFKGIPILSDHYVNREGLLAADLREFSLTADKAVEVAQRGTARCLDAKH